MKIDLNDIARWCKIHIPIVGDFFNSTIFGLSINIPICLILAFVFGRLLGEVILFIIKNTLVPARIKTSKTWEKFLFYARRLACWGLPSYLIHVLILDNGEYSTFLHIIMLPTALYIFFLVNILVSLVFSILLPRIPKIYFEIGFVDIIKSIIRGIVLMYVSIVLLRIFIHFNLEEWLKTLSTGAGIMTGIIALASKDFISNFFGALILIVSHPFKIGDWIVVNKFSGRVQKITMRTTQLKANSGIIIEVPNNVFVSKDVQNHGEGSYYAWTCKVSFATGHVDKACSFLEKIPKTLFVNQYLQKNRCHIEFKTIGEKEAEVVLHLNFKSIEEHVKLHAMHSLREKMHQLAQLEHVRLM